MSYKGRVKTRPDSVLTSDVTPTLGVIPAKAGIHFSSHAGGEMDPRFRGDDIGRRAAAVAHKRGVF